MPNINDLYKKMLLTVLQTRIQQIYGQEITSKTKWNTNKKLEVSNIQLIVNSHLVQILQLQICISFFYC